jgi:hypothetical protein
MFLILLLFFAFYRSLKSEKQVIAPMIIPKMSAKMSSIMGAP